MATDRLSGRKTLKVDGFLEEFEKDEIKSRVDIVILFSQFGVNLTRKGDFQPLRPMMWIWGTGTLIAAAPCPLGSGVRPVREVRSTVSRCHLAFANWS